MSRGSHINGGYRFVSDRLEGLPGRTRGDGLIDRRTITKAAMWSVPVVAAAVAVPLAAASTQPQVNLWSTAQLPATRDGVHVNDDYYEGPRSCVFTYTFGNFGPDALPVGAMLTIGLPFALIWNKASLNITNSGSAVLTPAGTRTATIDEDPLAVRQLWDFTLASELAANDRFTLNFTVDMNGSNNAATNHYRVRTTSNFQPGSGVTDTVPDNNAGFSSNYAYFNNINAG